jgi:cytosine/adenosine deaminase-related metal-dependent hydrolase
VSGPRVRLVHADAVIVGDGTAIRDGAVVLERGRVLDVGPAVDVMARATGALVERVHGVLLPALVNAHAHVELSGLKGAAVSGAGFVPWLASMQAARFEQIEEERDAAIDRAIAELVAAGVVGVGEVTNDLLAIPRLARALFTTVFHEVFSLSLELGQKRLASMAEQRAALDAVFANGQTLRYAVVPHALYSTHPELVRAVVRASAAAAADAPLTVHLAEHAAERAFLADGGGPLRRFFLDRGLSASLDAFPIPGKGPVAHAQDLGLLRAGAALVHLTDARPDELDLVAASGAIAVLCPRSNLNIETRLPPLAAMLERGVPIALGTDSLASAPSLDPLADARALRERFPEVPAATLVAAATSGSARAIGWGASLGVLAKGRAPGVLHVAPTAAVPFAADAPDLDPAAWLLRAHKAPRRWLARPAELTGERP